MKIIERIKKIMTDNNIKQIELANALGIGKSTINAWFNNNSDPKADQIEQIAKALKVSIEYLITGEEHTQHYTLDERRLIEQYRNTAPDGQTRIREYVSIMEREYATQKEIPDTEAKTKIS